MKKTMRLLNTAFAVILALCLCTFGIDVNVGATPTITVKSATGSNVTLSGQQFYAFKVFSAITDGSGHYTYSTDDSCLNSSGYTTVNADYTLDNLKDFDEVQMRTFADALYNRYIKLQSGNYSSLDNCCVGPAAADDGATSVTIDLSGKGDGYYLVVGKAKDSADGSTGFVTSLAMLDTATVRGGNAEIDIKADAPTIDKKVQQIDRDTTTNNTIVANGITFVAVSDEQIGTDIPFKITFTVPATMASYPTDQTYTLKVTDTLDSGLTYHDGLTVKAGDDLSNLTDLATTKYSATCPDHVLTVTFNNPIELAGKTVVVQYNAYMNASAKWANDVTDDNQVNQNSVKLTYSNDPYVASSTSDTVIVKSSVYTYAIDVVKTAADGTTLLKGAEFTLKPYGGDDTAMSFVADSTADPPTFRVALPGESGTTTTLTSGSSKSTFRIIGLDADKKYKLEETKAPEGYEKIGNGLDFTIVSTLSNSSGTPQIDTLTVNGSDGVNTYISRTGGDSDSNPLKLTIKNKAGGSKLAGTGGIGTSIFYVSGGILMAGALVLLVTKLRMRNKD